MWYGKGIDTEIKERAEKPKIDPHKYAQLDFGKFIRQLNKVWVTFQQILSMASNDL